VTPYRKLKSWAASAVATLSYRLATIGKRACPVAAGLLLLGANILGAEQVRVMQWNIHGHLGNMTSNTTAAAKALARIVNYNQPDVLLLNETDYYAPPATATALINWVTNNLPYMGSQPGVTFFVSVSAQPTYDSHNANAAISKYPILNDTTYNDGLRGLHAFKLQLATTNLQVFHTHIKCCTDNCPKKQTEAQFDSDTIKAFAATNSLPYIFAGDWNEDEQNPECTLSSTYHPITTIRTNGGLVEFKPTTLSGEYRTWSTASTPSIRFDYILAATNRLSPVSGFVFSTMDWAVHGLYTNASSQNLVNDTKTASDHFCVFADYSFSAPAPSLAVSPAGNFTSAGTQGGPFSPSSQTYTLTNSGSGSMNWTAAKTANWLTLSATSGTLAAGATTSVTVSINANANSLAANTYSDTVGFTNTSNGVGNTTRTVNLTVNPTPAQLAVGPSSGLSSSGFVGGPFSPSSQTYALTNVGGATLNWTANVASAWLSLSASSGTLAPNAFTNISVSVNANANTLAVNTYSDTVGFTNTSNGAGSCARAVSLTVNPTPALLAVGPLSGLCSSGCVGGPFNPCNHTYGLTNLGGTALSWTANVTANWLTLSATGGTLAAGATTNVTLSVNANANSLAANTYSDTVAFTNSSNGAGNATDVVSLTVNPTPAQLAVGPLSGFSSSGYVGGPFNPSDQGYTLTNIGGTTLDWRASSAASWVALSATGGKLAPGETTNVTVSVKADAQALGVGVYSDTISFTNSTTGLGDTNWPLNLTVNPIPLAALFTGSPTSGLEPLSVTFTDTSTGDITNRFWDFGDGATTNTTDTSVTHVYVAGTYDVIFVVSGPGGANTNTQAACVAALTTFQSWQAYYFGSTTNPDAAPDADPDHDGMTNWAEFQAATDPTNSASALRVTTVAVEGSDLRIAWTMGAGKTNVLQRADQIDGTSDFSDIFTVLAVGSVTNYLDAGAATNVSGHYYRVRLGP
jgi:PKD repeat protein